MIRLRINPLLSKELRIRMRNWRTFGMISLYLLALAGFTVLFFLSSFTMIREGYSSMAEVGRNLFTFLAIVQFVIVSLLVPSLVGNAISGERERQTIDLLTCTQLSSFGIVIGKLAAALSTVVLLIVASLPLYGFIFLLGGVSLLEVLILFLVILGVAFLVGCWSLMFSALFKRTVAAIVASYGFILFLFGGSTVLFALLINIFYSSSGGAPSILTVIVASNPLSHLGWIFPHFFQDLLFALDSNFLGLELWHIALLLQTGMAGISLLLATNTVNPLKGNKRKG